MRRGYVSFFVREVRRDDAGVFGSHFEGLVDGDGFVFAEDDVVD